MIIAISDVQAVLENPVFGAWVLRLAAQCVRRGAMVTAVSDLRAILHNVVFATWMV